MTRAITMLTLLASSALLAAQALVVLSWTNADPGAVFGIYHCNAYQQTFGFIGTNGPCTIGYQPSTNMEDWSFYCLTEDQQIPVAAFEPAAFFAGFEWNQTNIMPLALSIHLAPKAPCP